MKRNEIVESLLSEGFSEKTLVKFSDKQLISLHERIFSEETVNISKDDKVAIDQAKKSKQPFVTYEQEVGEELKGNQKKIDKNKNGKIDSEDFKLLNKKKKTEDYCDSCDCVKSKCKCGEKSEIKEWVKGLANENFHNFTSKNEIMELINVKLTEQQPAPSKPDTDAPVREKPTTKPGKPKRENPFEPKHKPKPKASSKDTLPDFLKFDNLGIKFKNAS